MRPHVRVALASGAVLAPLLVASTAGPAAAAATSLKVTTIGRNGSAVPSALQIMDVRTHKAVGGPHVSGGAIALPAGQYAVISDIQEADDDTLGAAVVTVSGATSVTLDARKGKPVRVSLDAAGLGPQDIATAICVNGAAADPYGNFSGGGPAGHTYVIPNASSVLRFAYLSRWDGSSPLDSYLATGAGTGVPTAPGGAFQAKSMVTEHVRSNVGPNGASSQGLYFVPQGSPCQAGLVRNSFTNFGSGTPYGYTAHLTAGTWDVRSDEYGQQGSQGVFRHVQAYAAGTSSSQTFYRAGWGPARVLPYVVAPGRVLFSVNNMFQDPYTTGFEVGSKTTATFSKPGKVLARKTVVGNDRFNDGALFDATLSGAAWYTLDASAVRSYPGVTYPASMLTPSSRAVFRFYANPKTPQVVPGVLGRFLISGLSAQSKAKPNSATPVGLFMDRADPHAGVPYKADTAKTVQAWYSTDNGKSWRGLHVTHTGSTWSTTVPNPATGKVSLSAKVTDAAGNSVQTYSNQAYAIG
ncbi:hypothetical protein [Streptomyces sp. NBC_01190]|uniref:hypothetical protein n=1 Tax=Streptomyces sp. NBC_01190 TaxID=2903767 RepID=UPI00386E093A|nr:hypothetical protein OG519_14710 [Streptomyces sp. NBC_01190]